MMDGGESAEGSGGRPGRPSGVHTSSGQIDFNEGAVKVGLHGRRRDETDVASAEALANVPSNALLRLDKENERRNDSESGEASASGRKGRERNFGKVFKGKIRSWEEWRNVAATGCDEQSSPSSLSGTGGPYPPHYLGATIHNVQASEQSNDFGQYYSLEDGWENCSEVDSVPTPYLHSRHVFWWKEVKAILALALPVAFATLCRVVIVNTDTAFIGHLGEKQLSGSTLGATWAQFLCNIAFSPGYSLNAVCSQAIGAKNYRLAGIWLQLALVVTLVLSIPVLVGYIFTDSVIGLFERDKEVVGYARDFNIYSMLVLFPMLLYMILRQFFQAMHIVYPAMVISLITVCFNVLMNQLFVFDMHLGVRGAPLATFCSFMFQITLFVIYCISIKGYHEPYWGGFSMDCFKRNRISRFMKIVVPMAIATIVENSGYQVIIMATGSIAAADVAAMAVLSNVYGLCWSFFWGFGLALQVRAAFHLGDGNPRGGRLVMRISIVMSVCVSCLVGALIYVFRGLVARVFLDSRDHDAIKLVEDSMHIISIDYICSCVGLGAINLLESMARNQVLAVVLTVVMWGIQVPLSLLFAFKTSGFVDNPIAGIWWGNCVGEIIKLIAVWYLISWTDWESESLHALERSEVGFEPREEVWDENRPFNPGSPSPVLIQSRARRLYEEGSCFGATPSPGDRSPKFSRRPSHVSRQPIVN